jgi:hypothetical protein
MEIPDRRSLLETPASSWMTSPRDRSWYDNYFSLSLLPRLPYFVDGTVAERSKMAAYLSYSVFLSDFVYPVIVHS